MLFPAAERDNMRAAETHDNNLAETTVISACNHNTKNCMQKALNWQLKALDRVGWDTRWVGGRFLQMVVVINYEQALQFLVYLSWASRIRM